MVQALAFDLPELLDALEVVGVAMVVFDREHGVRWANEAAVQLLGDDVERSAAALALDGGGAHDVVVRLAPLGSRNGESSGVLAVILPREQAAPRKEAVAQQTLLTPRQVDVLRLLGTGLSTEAIADRLGVAVETARNHIRALLRRLEVHSRLEAVVEARRRGLLD
jgi:DNA-binding NarL/FixJ family response regulator